MISSEKARNFVEGLPLEKPPQVTRSVKAARGTRAAETEQPAVTFRNDGQALAVGSQIAEFAENVPVKIRPAISNSILLAQLAANKAVKDNTGTSAAWRESYRNVLLNTGWLFEGSSMGMEEIKQDGLEVHKAIIPVLAAVLGPAVAAAAIVTTVLKGLQSMNEDAPWITLFNRESRRAKVSQFQIGYVQAPNAAVPKMSTIFFELEVTKNVTQVLFFKFSGAKGSLFYSNTDLSLNSSLAGDLGDAVRKKVAAYASTFIQEIQI